MQLGMMKPVPGMVQQRSQRPQVMTAATRGSNTESVPASTRRALLAALLIGPAVYTEKAQAVYKSSLCVDTVTEEEDTECRMNTLAKDQPQDYGAVSNRKFELAPNVPVADLNDEYTVSTLKLMDQIEMYCTIDVYDKQRIPLIKNLKSDANAWVAKYARGGSARSQSARRMYIAADAVIGHLASNGLAPLPTLKVRTVLKTVTEAREFLAKAI